MSVWNILGIEKTSDKNLIKDAYRKKLVNVNPEDDPEGFMELRKAYEIACDEADGKGVKNERRPVDNEMQDKISEIYNNFNRRISVDEWSDLFSQDEFVALDSSENSLETLLIFLMDNFHLPQNVWGYIIETFDLKSRRKELLDKFPEDYVDYIFSNAKFDDIIKYDLFEGETEDIDNYIDDYYQLDLAIRNARIGDEEKLILKLEESEAFHPYLVIGKIKHEIHVMSKDIVADITDEEEISLDNNKLMNLLELAEDTLKDVPDDINLINICGDLAILLNDVDKAEEYYSKSEEFAPENYVVRAKKAEILYKKGEFEKARDIYIELLKINHYDNAIRNAMIKSNMGIIENLKKKLEDDSTDNNARLDMAWSFYQSYNFAEALELLCQFEPTEEKACEYYNLKGRNYLCIEKYYEAMDCFFKWRDKILEIPEEDNSEDSQKKKVRISYVHFLIGECHLKLKQFDEARKYFEIALSKEHDEIVLSYEAMCELEFKTGDYNACIAACEILLEREERNYIACLYLAKSNFELNYLKETIINCDKAINIYPFMSDPYVYKVRVYMMVEQIGDAQNVIDNFNRYGIESDSINYYQAKIYEHDNKIDEAFSILEKIVERDTQPDYRTDIEDMADVYNTMGAIKEKKSEFNVAVELYNRAIFINDKHLFAHGRKGVLLRIMGKYESAKKELTRQLDLCEHPYYYVNRGVIYKAYEEYDSAISDFQSAIRLEPDNIFCYMKLGDIYKTLADFDKALYNYDMAIKYKNNNMDLLPTLYKERAAVFQCMLRFDESNRQYQECIKEFGLDAILANDYAELLYRQGNVQEAINILTECIRRYEYDECVCVSIKKLCYFYGIEGYIDKAHECFELGISKDKNECTFYGIMGIIFFEFDMLDKAKEMFVKAAELDVDNKNNYNVNIVEIISKKKGLFKPDINKFIVKCRLDIENKNNPDDFIDLGKIRRALKQPNDANKLFEQAYKIKRCFEFLYSECHEAMFEIGKTFEAMKVYDRAIFYYKKALMICGHNALYERRLRRIEENDSRN